MSPRSAAWPDHMARRITRRVRRAARLSWFAALLTALGASALLLAPRRLAAPDLQEVLNAAGATPSLPSEPVSRSTGPATPESPVQVHLMVAGEGSGPVDIRF